MSAPFRQFAIPGKGVVNGNNTRQFALPSAGVFNDTVPPGNVIGSLAEEDDTLVAAAVVKLAAHLLATEEDDTLSAVLAGQTHFSAVEDDDALAAITVSKTVFDLTTGLPAAWVYTGNGGVATLRDASGQMQLSTNNVVRLNHDINGVSLGCRHEGARTNLFTQFNMNPVDVSGFSATGTATIGLTSDTTALAAHKIDSVCTSGSVFEATGGASGGTVVVPGATGSTSNCSFSLYGRIVAGTTASITHNGTSPGSTAITGSTYARWKLENQAISATTVQMVVSIPANTTVRFILVQIEVGGFCSTVIKTVGSAVARTLEQMVDTSILTRYYFALPAGAVILDASFDNIMTNSGVLTPFFLGAGGTGFTNCIGMSTINLGTRRKTLSRYYVGGVQQYSPDIGSVDAQGQRFPMATSWTDGVQATGISGAGTFQTFNVGTLSGIDRLYIGSRGVAESIFGHLKTITFYRSYRTPAQLGLDMVLAGEKTILSSGQSNMTDHFSAQIGAQNSGEIAMKAVIDPIWSTTRNWVANGGTVGTSVKYYSATSTDADYWLNTDTGALGAPFRRWVSIAQGCLNSNIVALIDTSGESDAGNCTVEEFKTAMRMKRTIMCTTIGKDLPMGLIFIGRNTSALDGYQTIRQAQMELCSQYPSEFYRVADRYDVALADSIHMADGATGTTIVGTRIGRATLAHLGETISGGYGGPTIPSVVKSGTHLTVNLSHDIGGTDFTPSSAISGFRMFDPLGVEVTLSNIVQVSATSIGMDMSRDIKGTLYYPYGSLSTMTIANLVHDNSTQLLPIQASIVSVGTIATSGMTEEDDHLTTTSVTGHPVSFASTEEDDILAASAHYVHTSDGTLLEEDDVVGATMHVRNAGIGERLFRVAAATRLFRV